jgi:ParB-like chromosome segregation protein Spo0J
MPTPGARFGRGDEDSPYRPETSANDPRDIVIAEGWNVRDMTSAETRAWIETLKLSILTNGYNPTKPITVRYDRKTGVKTLVDGQCRLTACQELWNEGHEIIVPEIRTDGDEATLTAESISGNAQLYLTQWEIGEGCRRLTRFGWSIDKIAASICKSKRYVTDAIALSNVSLDAKAMLSSGEVTTGAVLHAVKEYGPDKAAEALQGAVESQQEKDDEDSMNMEFSHHKTSKPKPVSRPKAASKKEVKIKTVLKAVKLLLDDVEEAVLENEGDEYVSVDRVKLLTLSKLV